MTTTNIDALEIDYEILSKLSGEEQIYLSEHTAHDENSTNLDEIVSDGFIISSIPNGLPQHKLL